MTLVQGQTLTTGQLVGGGRFKIIKFLGQGNFGETYLAEDGHDSHSRCALKRFSFVSNDPTSFLKAKELFEREAQVLKDLTKNTENHLIPQYIAYLADAQEWYLAQEYIEGCNLREELQKDKTLNEDKVASLLEDVLNSLTFIHGKKTIHRDIKPENLIRRNRDGKIFLIDFGAVKQDVAKLTSPGTKIYTEGYAPLEQIQGYPQASSDIYALGMTALEALTGVEPEKLKDVTTGKVLWPPSFNASDKLKKILEKMVEHNCQRRYQSAEKVLNDLNSAGFTATVVVAPGWSPTVPSVQNVGGGISKLPMWLWFAIAAPLVMILAFTLGLLFVPHPPKADPGKPQYPQPNRSNSSPSNSGSGRKNKKPCPPILPVGKRCEE
ncbi:MAG: serine/threonine protein kinase [Oscillatoriales cyanobacterium]|uniref:serine/threonine-protein kinase n=1 Tax=Microcoleus anatoxicus TaxID=2705319 RepID=UPI00297B7E73|nr:MAG: serine/threonine protein kinase [Oscillatoriales cyanobacterium]TAE03599.1 MAG: serine/threonine protein kinase [Oscillatoriales cyanobacterium]TAE98155.1 MAG: serine/threonine protein kinase [Oscillatoriales cyanobacterium]TAF61979.1 MAG: serine/threonine protein kinase [Oscillatoriales cyanobacterium]